MSQKEKIRRRRSQRKKTANRQRLLSIPKYEQPYTLAEYEELRTTLRLHNNWDLLLIGDGSARRKAGACAWAVTLYNHTKKTKRVFYGGMSEGSCVIAELVPYIQALLWHSRFYLTNEQKIKQKPCRVLIVTDAQAIAQQGNNLEKLIQDSKQLNGMRPFWLLFFAIVQNNNYEIKWQWHRRGSLTKNREMNQLARSIQRQLTKFKETTTATE